MTACFRHKNNPVSHRSDAHTLKSINTSCRTTACCYSINYNVTKMSFLNTEYVSDIRRIFRHLALIVTRFQLWDWINAECVDEICSTDNDIVLRCNLDSRGFKTLMMQKIQISMYSFCNIFILETGTLNVKIIYKNYSWFIHENMNFRTVSLDSRCKIML